jgi:hypothetical protein
LKCKIFRSLVEFLAGAELIAVVKLIKNQAPCEYYFPNVEFDFPNAMIVFPKEIGRIPNAGYLEYWIILNSILLFGCLCSKLKGFLSKKKKAAE